MNPLHHAGTHVSELFSTTEYSKHISLLGSTNGVITLGCFNINYAVHTLAQYCVAPRKGHLEALQRVFGYLKHHPQGMLLIDSSDPFCQKQATLHQECDLSEHFPTMKKIYH